MRSRAARRRFFPRHPVSQMVDRDADERHQRDEEKKCGPHPERKASRVEQIHEIVERLVEHERVDRLPNGEIEDAIDQKIDQMDEEADERQSDEDVKKDAGQIAFHQPAGQYE